MVLLEAHTERFKSDMPRFKRLKRLLQNSPRCSKKWLCLLSNRMRQLLMWRPKHTVWIQTSRQGKFNAMRLHVHQGSYQFRLVQTDKAVESARRARRKKWICFWIVGKSTLSVSQAEH